MVVIAFSLLLTKILLIPSRINSVEYYILYVLFLFSIYFFCILQLFYFLSVRHLIVKTKSITALLHEVFYFIFLLLNTWYIYYLKYKIFPFVVVLRSIILHLICVWVKRNKSIHTLTLY